MKDLSKFKSRLLSASFWIALSLTLTVIAGGFSVTYTGNQTTKFLFGLASGGYGDLARDWLANTQDPLPLFSYLVQFTYQYLGEIFFQVYQVVLVGVFLFSMVQISDHFFNIRRSKLLYLGFLGIYLSLFSKLWPARLSSVLFNGVALQDLALNQFLPNVFGVFLFLSLALFLNKKYVYSIIALCVAGYFHSGYLIAGAVLTSSYIVIEFLETRDYKKVLTIGVLALVLISPVVFYSLQANTSASVEQVQRAAHIIVNERIPHHTQVSIWWNKWETARLLLAVLAIVLMRRSKVLPLLVIAFLTTFAPPLVLTIRPSNAIAILQIWRASVFLIPLSSTLIIGSLLSSIYTRYKDSLHRHRNLSYALVGLLTAAAFAYGLYGEIMERDQYQNMPERPMYTYISDSRGAEDLYLIPPRDNNLQGFRFETGAPILVNWKSHPWNTLEFLEWYDRVEIADAFYQAAEEDARACLQLSSLTEAYPITHVLAYPEFPLDCPGVDPVYQGEFYLLYALTGEE